MKKAVFFIQNQTTFSCACAQPNSHPKKRDASTEDPRVAQSICGTASNDATSANRIHGCQTAQSFANAEGRASSSRLFPAGLVNANAPCKSARHAPINRSE